LIDERLIFYPTSAGCTPILCPDSSRRQLESFMLRNNGVRPGKFAFAGNLQN
jgi:hypothetical protein